MLLIDATGEIRDTYTRIDESAEMPARGDLIVPLARLDEVQGFGRVGIHIENDVDWDTLKSAMGRVDLISIAFPKYADGRGFSIARRLRNAGFRGELRAHGPLIADQFPFALAVGFTTVEIPETMATRQPLAQWMAALKVVAVTYQADFSKARNILQARHRTPHKRAVNG